MENSVVSFFDEENTRIIKHDMKRKRRAAVRVEYNSSGSEADIESDQQETIDLGEGEDVNDSDEPVTKNMKPIPGAGWADAMAKILGKTAPVTSQSVLLAKSKSYQKAKEEQKQENITRIKERVERKNKIYMGRAKPNLLEREIERKLQRIATRGVVQLFNAVKQQQKSREEKLKEVGASEKKRIQVEQSFSKGAFVDMLKGTEVKTKPSNENKNANVGGPKPAWSALRDDFLMGATLKDWDQSDDEKEEDAKEERETVDLSSDSDE